MFGQYGTPLYVSVLLIGVIPFFGRAGTLCATYKAKKELQTEFDAQSLVRAYIVTAVSSIPSLLILWLSPRGMSSLLKLVVGGTKYIFVYLTLIPLAMIVTIAELRSASLVIRRIRSLRVLAEPVLEYEKRILHLDRNARIEERTYMSSDSLKADSEGEKLNSKMMKQLSGGVLVLVAIILGGIQILRIHNIYGAGANRWYFYGLVGILGSIGIMLIIWSFVNKEKH